MKAGCLQLEVNGLMNIPDNSTFLPYKNYAVKCNKTLMKIYHGIPLYTMVYHGIYHGLP